jgi:hypothetical protein
MDTSPKLITPFQIDRATTLLHHVYPYGVPIRGVRYSSSTLPARR